MKFIQQTDYSKTNTSIWGQGDTDTITYLQKIKPQGTWLNLAAGDGRYMDWLLQTSGDVFVSDIDEEALKALVRLCTPEERNRIKPVMADITKPLPFSDNYFDGVFSTGTFHLFSPDINAFIYAEILRVLKNSGQCIFTFATDIKRLKQDGMLVTFPDETSYTLQEAKIMLQKALSSFTKVTFTEAKTEEDLTQEPSMQYYFSCNYWIVQAIK